MNSKLVLALVVALAPLAAGCAVSSKADAWSGGGIPSVIAAGHDGSSERGATVAMRNDGPIGRTEHERTIEARPVALHEALTCARCR